MKFQCPCGAKFAFDLTPEMVENPVKFVCPTCGLDHSEFINGLIRREFNAPEPAYQRPVSEPAPPPPPPAAPGAPRLRISHAEKPAEAPAPAVPVSKFCQRHRNELIKDKCFVCGTPICSRCMESFGYLCSPLCRNKADLQGLDVPVYAGQKFEKDRQFWAKSGKIFTSCLAVIFLLFATWAWYTFYGSWPHPYLAVRFEDDDRAYAGKSVIVDKNQLVFLHGGTLARYDLKSKKAVWSDEIITKADIEAAVKAEEEADQKANDGGGGYTHRQTHDTILQEMKISMQHDLQLHVSGQNVWVEKGDKLTQYDWATGAAGHSVQLPELGGELIETGGELQSVGAESVTHVSLADGSTRIESFTGKPARGAGRDAGGSSLASDNGQALDPAKIANEAANMKLQGRIALPALIANAQHEKQLEAAMRETDPQKRAALQDLMSSDQSSELVAGDTGFMLFSKKLLEEKMVEHEAMKAPPKTSALEDNPSVANTGAIVNEQLNEMRRNSGDDKTVEDLSRYQVTVHLPDGSAPDFSAEVTGPPQLLVLKTVNVIAAGKGLIVLDKSNKKLWSADLTYAVDAGGEKMFPGEKPRYGDGPCVEHGDSLYVFDQAVLTAFDLSSGNARWRVPSVGVVGLFFDDKDNIYVNTTSGNPDDIKYAKQIDVTKQTDDILMKLAPKDGKTLWSIKPGGFISYLQGKYIYLVESFDPNPDDEDQGDNNIIGMMKPASLRITRINPRNGHVMWDTHQDRCPVDIHFDNNTIELVFKREVQVLKFLSF
jgi:hypothetical protein